MKKLKVKKLDTWTEKLIGLIGKDKAVAVFFTTRWGIHTFFMKFPIDVVILDKKDSVVFMKEHVGPGRILMWNPIYCRVLELPAGSIKRKEIKMADCVKLCFF